MKLMLTVARLCAGMLALAAAGAGATAPERDASLYRAVQENRPDALALLQQIVNIDSGTGDVEGGSRVAAVLAQRLSAIGAAVHTEPAEVPGLPDNLVAVLQGTGKGRILIIGHIDTVFASGTVAGRPFSIEGHQAHGPGVGDEKGGVMIAVSALKILHDLHFRNYALITLLLDDSEERGSPGSRALIELLVKQHDVVSMSRGAPRTQVCTRKTAAMRQLNWSISCSLWKVPSRIRATVRRST